MKAQPQVGADEVVRALAAAAAAVRLYPPTSEIPTQAVARFVSIATQTTAQLGPVRFVVEPKAFRFGEDVIGESQTHVSAFAEALYAHQAGQLIVAPGVTDEETVAFLRCVGADASAAREEGGLRAVAVAAGVTHLAVIELTLRTSTEEGLAGLDLTSAPLEAIGPAITRAAAEWARSAAGGQGRDEVAEVVGGLEAATREMATERVGQALMQMDEKTRAAVLAAALRQDASGAPMDGMLAVVAGMKPATLARLLTLAAGRTGADPQSLLPRLELPPEAMRALSLLLRPSPRTEAESGVPPSIDVDTLASEAAVMTEEDEAAVQDAIAAADGASAAARGLSTTLVLARRSRDSESVAAVGDAAWLALPSGSFHLVREALHLLDELGAVPELEIAVTRARQSLAQPEVLATACSVITDQLQALDAGAVLAVAGAPGSEALVDSWLGAPEPRRVLLQEAARALPELVIAAASRRLREAGPAGARDIVSLLAGLNDRRAVAALAQALDHAAAEVRAAAIDGLAALDTEDAWSSIVSSLTHPDEATARKALDAIRVAGRRQAVPAMLAVLQIKTSGARNQALKGEIIQDVLGMGALEALPTLEKMASRRIVFGRKARELRDAARRAVADLESSRSGE